ncbi:MAG TPA: transcriptional repressor [Solirubrobacteraceae bacterium]|jgi:Fur family ferric uptake transcriptional regulator|nr:transcriptional repressor [Solirubrobacteraceae bacterium]
MTVSPDVPPLVVASLADAVTALRERGLRLSTSRRLVLEALFAADGPVSAEYVARRSSLDAASVHRNFETLERHGLVRHVHLGHGPGLYALLGRGEREYLYCDRCGAVRALPSKELDPVRKRIRERYGYETRFTHFAIVGTCGSCSAQVPHTGGAVHEHASTEHGHEQLDHDHAHSHGDHVHAHPHVHQDGLEDQREHGR